MNFEMTDDERAVIDAARQVAQAPDPWAALVEGGWLDLLLDDPDNGLSYLGLVAEELGYAGVSVPLSGTAGVWPQTFGTSAGGRRVGVMVGGLCEDGVGADVVIANDDGVARAYEAFEIEPLGGLDGDRLARVTVSGDPIATSDDEVGVRRGGRVALALVCAEMGGLFRRIQDLTLEHLRTREQFGKPLASFQVVQHGAARLATLAEAATWAGRLAVADPSGETAHATKGWLSAAAHELSALAHQLHGAIGFTEEYGLQRLTKRLRTLRFTWGDDPHHHEALGRLRAAGTG